jgi:hypothetical protein
MAGIITSKSNGHVLTFRENPYHVYHLDGEKIPSATDVKKAYPPGRQLIRYYIKQGLEEFDSGAKLKAKADIGSIMHDYCHAKRMGLPFDDSLVAGHPDEEKILKRLNEVDAWLLKQKKDKILKAEIIVASITHKYGGKFDAVIERDGKIIIQDYKSAKGFFTEQFLQMGGYDQALMEWEGMHVDGYEVVRFNDNTKEPKSFLITDPNELQEFREEFIRLRYSRAFQKKWDKFFEDMYEKENPWIKESKKKKKLAS